MATKKKTEVIEEPKAEAPVNQEIYELEELYKMKFKDVNGATVMVRKAYKPRGKLEFYQPREE